MQSYQIILFGYLIVFSIALNAQILEEDSIKADTRYDKLFYTTDRYHTSLQLPDTALTGFGSYNPIYKGDWAHTFLGNIGQAHSPLAFERNQYVGFDMGWHGYDRYRLHPDSVRYYTSPYPFSEIKYILGTGEEQFLTAEVGLPVKKNWHINTLYRLMVGAGNYNRQRVSWHNAIVSTNYEHHKQRYRLQAFYLLNNGENEQNGGIKTTEFPTTSPRTVLDPYLTKAADVFNEHHFSLQQTYDGGTWYDVVKEDTTITKLFPTRRLGHRIAYQSFTRRYADSQMPASYYPDVYFNPLQTNDSTRWRVLQNEFFVTLNDKRLLDTSEYHAIPFESTFQARAGFLHELIGIDRLALSDTLSDDTIIVRDTTQYKHSGILQGRFQNNVDSRFHFWAEGQYALFGYNIADFKASGGVTLRLSRKVGGIRGKAVLQNISPNFMSQQYVSNTAIWQNSFRKVQGLQFWATYFNDWLHLAVTYANHTFTNYIVWNEEQLPEQFENIVNISQLELKHHLRWRKWHFENAVMLQIPSDSRLRIPRLVGRHLLYIESGLFKGGSTKIQLGLEVNENTNYAVDAYAPAIGQFYRQANVLSFYPIVDIFAHVKVRRMRMFVKLRHANQGLFGLDGYFNAPQHPANDRNLQFGLSWMFFD